jgi:hypothetical protein
MSRFFELSGGNMARAAFYQDLTYNKKQKTIRFRNLTIDTEEVNNEKIVYKITQD